LRLLASGKGWHLPAAHAPPWQSCPHAPQFFGSLWKSAQPLAQQTFAPVHAAPPEHLHAPAHWFAVVAEHAVHALPPPPHTLVVLPGLHVVPLQHPFGHDVASHTHLLPEQCCPAPHAFPHPPQFASSLLVSIEQPSASLPVQCAKGAVHAKAHFDPLHEGVPFAVPHACPQPPQCATSLYVSTSQPVSAF